MNRLGLVRFFLLAAALGALSLAGCEKSKEGQDAVAAQAVLSHVTDQQMKTAREQVQQAWANVERQVTQRYKPAPESRSFYLDLAVLTRHPHRLAGYGWQAEDKDLPGSIAAARHVANRLMAMGFKEVFTQDFPVVQPVTTECKLLIDGRSYPIHAMRPNILQAPVTPAEGISGRTIYVGRGEAHEYKNTTAKDQIVVMDFDSGKNWLRAFAFGARAVLFIGSDKPAANTYHHLNQPANLPRFYVPKDLARKLELRRRSRHVKLLAACQWRQMRGRNVVAVLRGEAPKFDENRPDQAIVLAAPLDSLSEAPALSPGARDAANCAALLQIAEYLRKNPPKRDIIFCFFDAQAQAHMGARAFYGAVQRKATGVVAKTTLEQRLKIFADEREYRMQLRRIIDEVAPLAKIWEPWGRFYESKSDLREQEDYLKDRRKELAESRAGLEKIRAELEKAEDTPAEQLAENAARTAKVDRRIAEVDRRLRDLQARMPEELARLDEQMALLDAEMSAQERNQRDLFGSKVREMPRHGKAVRFLRDEAKYFDSDVLDKLRPARVRIKQLKSQLTAAEERRRKLRKKRRELGKQNESNAQIVEETARNAIALEETGKTIETLEENIERLTDEISSLARRTKSWNTLIRDLFEGEITPESRGRFAILLTRARNVLDRRIRELDALTEQTRQSLILRNAVGHKRNAIVLHVSINLGDARNLWTFIHGDDTAPIPPDDGDKVGHYGGIFKAMREVFKGLADEVKNFDERAISPTYENQNRMFAPGLFADSGGIARIFAIYNVSAMTSMDRLSRNGQPADTLAALDAEVVYKQGVGLASFLKRLADNEDLNVPPKIQAQAKFHETMFSGTKNTGPAVKRIGGGTAMPDRPVRDAIVAVAWRHASGPWYGGRLEKSPPGFVFPIVVKTDTNGLFELGPASKVTYKASVLLAATFDRTSSGTEESAPGHSSRGIIDYVSTEQTATGGLDLTKTAVTLFETRCKTVVGYGFNRGAIATKAMRARSTAPFRLDRSLRCEADDVLTVFAPRDASGLKLFNKTAMVLLNNAPTEDDYEGQRISLVDQFDHPVAAPQTARDLGVLNAWRATKLRDAKIVQPSLEILNSEAMDLKADADAQRPKPSQMAEGAPPELKVPVEKYMGDQAASAALSRRAYGPLVGVMNDLVTAVVLLLLLAMPFAFALERLLIGTPHIYRQIGWFALFFVITFGVLYFVNPAFRIAATPTIIFLAFTIILLSSLVIFIMIRKLQAEIKKIQGLATTVHSADVSRLSTMLAAVNMGISTMRRRPVRTLLTAVTVVLLTFTILSFASFGSSWDLRTTYEGPMSDSSARILLRHQLWGPIAEGVGDMLRGHLRGRATVVPTYWISSTAQETKDQETIDMLLATGDKLARIATVAAAIGLDPIDIEKQPNLKELFMSKAGGQASKKLARLDLLNKDGIILTDAVRNDLRLTEDDVGKAKVLLAGMEFTYAGTVDDRLAIFSLLEGSKMLPVDYQTSSGSSLDALTKQAQSESLIETADMESAQFVHYNVDKVALIPPRYAKIMKGRIRYITVYPTDAEKTQEIARQVAKTTAMPTYVGDRSGMQRMIFTSLAEASGVRDLLIPVLLGGLIVFATMLGSVSDREREIYTFSSLGLAPAHVASLFFAEASIYAVVGGMGGYLLGQIVARVLGYLAELRWVAVPTMNYSSTNAIVTVLIVMCTVLISTVYPAVKASRSANPGIQRAWKIPKPDGNLYDLIFPFTVSAYDIIGVVSFLREHFDNYSDTSLGVFTSMECHIFRQKDNDMLGFRASVALAPFDLGVTQNFAMLSQPSDIEGIDEVRILIHRLSGAQGDWRRSNRVFIKELRKQLLIWRSLPEEIMERYRERTLETWDALPVEQVDHQSIGGSA